MSTCRSCGAPITWARSVPGARPMPLDPEPNEAGNVALERGRARVLAGDALTVHRSLGLPAYMPHHATCPQGRHWKARA